MEITKINMGGGKTVRRTIYNSNLLTPDSVTVELGKKRKTFPWDKRGNVGGWMMDEWSEMIFPAPAYVFYNIGWDNDHVLYCEYVLEGGE